MLEGHGYPVRLPQFPSLARVCKPSANGVNCLGIADGFSHFAHLAPHRQRLLRFPALVKSFGEFERRHVVIRIQSQDLPE